MAGSEYIVGIGASAGGLEAINQLFDNMPENTGATFIVIQHLSPDYKSLMPELLAKHTVMQVYEASDGMALSHNCIYLIPSKKTLTIKKDKLKLADKNEGQIANFAIDIFFESLAKEKGKNAIGIILSGTGTDGTKGIEAIHNSGGYIIVQEPMSALFDGMPNSAINSGMADIILPPDMMAEELLGFTKDAPFDRLIANQDDENVLQDIIILIKRSTTHDFTHYKRATIYRRLSKRLMELNCGNLKEYYYLLVNQPGEVKALLKELLINVTRFFRDEEAFEKIKTQVIPNIFSSKKPGETIKIWVTACSSGEEAYSLAILFEEHRLRHRIHDVHVKIFATDIDEEALDSASRGSYSREHMAGISAERMERFFELGENQTYKVIATLRKMVVVAKHDLINDPPFSKLDFISCRNMLIYMNPVLQKSVLRTFHFAIQEGGYLFLGPSENIDILKDAVKEVDRKWKIFKVVRKINLQENRFLLTPLDKQSFYQSFPDSKPRAKNALHNLSDVFRDTLLEVYSFAGIFIDREFEVKQAIGNFRDFLNFPESQFNFNLLKMVPQELSIALGAAVRKAVQIDEKVIVKKIKLHEEKRVHLINIIVKPYLQQNEYLQPFLFVILNEEEQEKKIAKVTKTNNGNENMAGVEELESELKETRENLQAVIEELESANEELQSHTEEMITSNEELQSTNEELQSLNEELHTVSAEHQMKIKELLELNDDLNNYFRASSIGQILIDKKLIIRRFSPRISEQINLVEADLGRSIVDFSIKVRNIDFVNDIKEVIKTGKPLEKEVKISADKTFLMRIHPYIRLDKSIDGVVVTFYDITEIKKLNNVIESIFNSSLNGITALRSVRNEQNEITDFEWTSANTWGENLLGHAAGELIGRKVTEEFPGMKEGYLDAFMKVVQTGIPFHFEYFKEHSTKWLEIVTVKLEDGLVLTFNDITDRKKAEELISRGYENLKVTSKKLSDTNFELEQSNFDLMQFASVASHDLKEPLRKIQVFGNLLEEKLKDKITDSEKEFLDRMLQAAARMQKLIDDILTLSKLSNRDNSYKPTDLNKIISNLLEDLEITIKDKNAIVEVDKLPKIDALEGQMHQLFQNLVTNALKFNDSNQPIVIIKHSFITKAEAEQLKLRGEAYVKIVVEDNGIGFDKEYEERIFGVFQRLHGSKYAGTGIGLAISRKIAENHGGLIAARSEVNKGSRFTVILPIHHEKVEMEGSVYMRDKNLIQDEK